MSKWTPGPWSLAEVKNDSGRITHLVPIDSEKLSLLTVVDDGETYFGAVYLDSDARLIAAAPEMYEAIAAIATAMNLGYIPNEILSEGSPILEGLRAAIAKAEGK